MISLKLYIGVDLGTSAVKLLLMDGEGQIKNVVSKEYPLEFPQPKTHGNSFMPVPPYTPR